MNTLIRVDRITKFVYPDWVKKVMHPELENQGPAEYDLSKVDLWLHEDQKDGKWAKGENIYARLKQNNGELLKTCLTLRDSKEIKKNGTEVYRVFFKDKALFLWGSIVQHNNGNFYVPCLRDLGDSVVELWRGLGHDWDGCSPAGRNSS